MSETPLPGGAVNQVVRVGTTVRRPQPARPAFVHRLLRLLEERGWAGAPRFLGTDEKGREVLSWVGGQAGWDADWWGRACSDEALVATARLVREFHDLTHGTSLAAHHEVVCHNDLAPKNTVFAPLGAGWAPVAFIDWDLAAPGERVHDVAHLCWQYLDLGPGVTDLPATARRVRTICDAYGLEDRDRERLAGVILWWQERCWRGIEEAAERGEAAMIRLCRQGIPERIRAAQRWVSEHLAVFEAGSSKRTLGPAGPGRRVEPRA
ncbi:phosphotransferase [Streptomyces sp. NPDC003077]|uniref:phosphotransferase n=1 Tax=Streptomyces sp. NPDC003077 TaxID=3154443 RepID=UPI0033A7D101